MVVYCKTSAAYNNNSQTHIAVNAQPLVWGIFFFFILSLLSVFIFLISSTVSINVQNEDTFYGEEQLS